MACPCQMTNGDESESCPLTGQSRRHPTNCQNFNCFWTFRLIVISLTAMCLTAIGYLIYLQSLLGRYSEDDLLFHHHRPDHGAVATDNFNCSRIGTDILKKGGNAVDAAIAATFCMAVVTPYKTGLGGGGIAMVDNDGVEQTEPLVVDFATNAISGIFPEFGEIRIPSFIRGLEVLHKEKGKLKWNKLLEPAEKLSKNGFIITQHFFKEVSKVPNYETLYGNLEPGKLLKLSNLGNTLEMIKNFGTQTLYNGTLALRLFHDDNLLGELTNYQPTKSNGKKSNLDHYVLYSPQHAELFHSIIAKIEKLNLIGNKNAVLDIAKIIINNQVEDKNSNTIMKSNLSVFLLGIYRLTVFTNVSVEQEQYATVVAVDSDNNLVSILTGLSSPLSPRRMTEGGFVLDTIHTGNNFYSFIPVIFHSKDLSHEYSGVFGFDDPLLASEILSNLIIFKLNLSVAIETQRYYRVLDGIVMEPIGQYPLDDVLKTKVLQLVQHTGSSFSFSSQYSKSINGIVLKGNSLISHSDSRGGGIASRYEKFNV